MTGWQPWPEARNAGRAYPPSGLDGSPWEYGHAPADDGVVTGVLTPPGLRIPPPPPVLPPGELDTVTGPISMSGTARRRDEAPAAPGDHFGYSYEDYLGYAGPAADAGHPGDRGHHDDHTYPAGGALYRDGRAYSADAGYPADAGYGRYDETRYDETPGYDVPEVPPAAASTTRASLSAAVGNRAIRAARLDSEPEARSANRSKDSGNGQRPPGAHRAPLGRPGSARAKLAIMSTASVAGLSALVGTAVLATDTGSLTIPGGTSDGTTAAGQWPSALASGAEAPVTAQLAPAPDQAEPTGQSQSSTGTDSGDDYYAADSPLGLSDYDTYPSDGLTGTEVPVVPLTPLDESYSADPSATASDEPSDSEPSSFDWFGLGQLVDGATGDPTATPSATPTTTPEQTDGTTATPAPEATSTDTTGTTGTTGTTAATDDLGQQQSSTTAQTDSSASSSTAASSTPADPFVVTSPDPVDTDYALTVLDWLT